MQLTCDLSLAANYKSQSQISRVLSEAWMAKNGYCLACDCDELRQYPASNPAGDFYCPKCKHDYELKAFQNHRPSIVPDGKFDTLLSKIQRGVAPSLCLLERTPDWQIRALTAFHSSFLLPDTIRQRKPTRPKGRNEEWVGSDILVSRFDPDAEVEVISSGIVVPVQKVRAKFARFLPLAKKSAEQRGWTLLTLRLVRSLGKNDFSLADVYELETKFSEAYPQNKHVKDKIRQQLQILRDLGVVEFVSRGEYRLRD